jgi:hypothetical protein
MGSTGRRLFAFGALVPLAGLTTLLYLALFTDFDGRPDGPLQTALFALYWVLLAAGIATWVWAFVLIRRSPRLRGDERTKWTWLVIFGTVFILPVIWWRFVRPAPHA